MAGQSHALFFAIKPDAEAAAKLLGLGRRLRDQHGLKGRLFEAARLHMTLHFFGRYPTLDEAFVQSLCHAAEEVHAEPFHLRLDHVGGFKRASNAPLVVRAGDDAPGAKALYQHLGAALVRHRLGEKLPRRFVPHVTLLYDDKSLPEFEIDPIEWAAHAFELVHSESGRGHRVLHQWPLLAA